MNSEFRADYNITVIEMVTWFNYELAHPVSNPVMNLECMKVEVPFFIDPLEDHWFE